MNCKSQPCIKPHTVMILPPKLLGKPWENTYTCLSSLQMQHVNILYLSDLNDVFPVTTSKNQPVLISSSIDCWWLRKAHRDASSPVLASCLKCSTKIADTVKTAAYQHDVILAFYRLLALPPKNTRVFFKTQNQTNESSIFYHLVSQLIFWQFVSVSFGVEAPVSQTFVLQCV